MKEILRATAACCSEEEFAEVITKHADQIAQYGYPKIYTVNLAYKKEVVDCLLKQNFDYGVHAMKCSLQERNEQHWKLWKHGDGKPISF